MTDKTDWEKAAAADGITDSERALTRLARKAFLSLWSYSNVFTDEGRSKGKGDGKELCDLLVVFGNNVLIFSDKHCDFQFETDVKVAWPRWYKRAIEKSVRQLAGAEKFARSFPKRIFLDKDCQAPLPIALPDAAVAKYYLIAVTRGSQVATSAYFGGGSSGSLMLDSSINGAGHYQTPFRIGHPLPGRFVHVLDEVTVDLLLEELDTVPDLVSYLDCKGKFLQQPGVIISVPGEEELLARYMAMLRDGQHALPEVPKGVGFAALPEGDWNSYSRSPQRAAKRKADEGSYMWDALIEHQSSFIRAGTAATIPLQSPAEVDHERIVRALAEQNRLARRQLSEQFRYALSKNDAGQMFARTIMTGKPPSLAFVFLTVSKPVDMEYETYRTNRMHALMVYCHGIKEGTPTLQETVGIACEPFSEAATSQDFIYVDLMPPMDDDERKHWREAADELGILRPKTEVELFRGRAHEFPLPFRFENIDRPNQPESLLLNRAARRRLAKEARKKKPH